MALNLCSYEPITVGELRESVALIGSENPLAQYFLPKYQRPATWSEKLRIELIQSLRRGFPIGSLLLSKRRETDAEGHDTWLIIDGQQRTLSILDYYAKKSSFLKLADIPSDLMELLRPIAAEALQLELSSESFKLDLFECLSHTDLDNPQSNSFWSLMCRNHGISESRQLEIFQNTQLQFRTAQLLKRITDSLDISDVKLPLIKFQGPDEFLPEIFEALNKGVKLDKYEQLAASWQLECKVEAVEIQSGIQKYWVARTNEGEIEIDGLDDDGMPLASSLFDVLSGLGRLACEKYPRLFKDGWYDSLAFNTAAICHSLRLNELNKLQSRFALNRTSDGRLEVDEFGAAFLRCCSELDNILKSRLGLKLNRESQTQFPGHSQYQIVSMVVFLMLEMYEPGSWKSRSAAVDPGQHSSQLLAWYVFDMLEDDWGNAGDSKLFNRIWLTADTGSGVELVLRHEYVELPNKIRFRAIFDAWIGKELARQDSKRYSADPVTKVILKYFYSLRVSYSDNHNEKFHLDHLVPVTWWAKLFEYFAELKPGMPINSVGNLCLMKKSHNSKKRGKLPIDWYMTYVPSGNETIDSFQRMCRDEYFLIREADSSSPNLESFEFPEAPAEFERHEVNDLAYLDQVLGAFTDMSERRWHVISQEIAHSLGIDWEDSSSTQSRQ